MKKVLLTLIAFIVVSVVILAYTNPADDVLKEQAGNYVKNEVKGITGGLLGSIKSTLIGEITNIAAQQTLTVENHFLYKKVTFSLNGYTKTMGYGYLNGFHPSKD